MVGKTPDSELDMIMALDMKIPTVDEVGIYQLRTDQASPKELVCKNAKIMRESHQNI
jgi:hypothetical protein